MSYRMKFMPPPGVNIQQNYDGMLLIHYDTDNVAPLRAALGVLSEQLLNEAIAVAEKKKADELARQDLPKTKLQVLDAEIDALKAAAAPSSIPPALAQMESVGRPTLPMHVTGKPAQQSTTIVTIPVVPFMP